MNVMVAFGIGALVFIFSVLFTAYFLKSASFLESSTNKGNAIETQEFVDDVVGDVIDDVNDPDVYEKMLKES